VTGRALGGAIGLAVVLALPMAPKDVPPFESVCAADGTVATVTPDTQVTRKAANTNCGDLKVFNEQNPTGRWFEEVVSRIRGATQ
jgi:hypothetical protein